MACSADGKKLVAAISEGAIYSSVDGDVTWSPSDAPETSWVAVASSADGSRLIAVSRFIYLSTNSGANWHLTDAPEGSWLAATASADGNKFWVVGLHGMVMSTDGGLTWPPTLSFAAGGFLTGIAGSADGTRLLVGIGYDNFPNAIRVSTNSGVTWYDTTSPAAVWYSVVSSADGTRLAGSSKYDFSGLVTSTNAGTNWTRHNFSGSARLTCSADGSKLIASTGGNLYVSTNWAETWSTNLLGGEVLAASADGNKLIAVAQNALWISQSTPEPFLNIAASSGQCVLSWLIPSAPFALEENSDLNSIGWTPVAESPAINLSNLQFEAILPSQSPVRFYRLKGQ